MSKQPIKKFWAIQHRKDDNDIASYTTKKEAEESMDEDYNTLYECTVTKKYRKGGLEEIK